MIAQLPKSPSDGQIAVDFSGSRYRYYAELNQWVNIGNSIDSQVVDYKQDGMITPNVVGFLEQLRAAAITDFKLLGNEDIYYYLFKAYVGRLFLFTVEGQNVRIELNRAALGHILKNSACQGATGKGGIQGLVGDNGISGSNETTYTPQIDGYQLSIAVPIQTPLTTEVSFRLLNGDRFIEIWYDVGSGTSSIIQSTETITSHTISIDDGEFTATINIDGDWGDGWTAKIRQRGPFGRDGVNGDSFITISETDLYAFKATEFIASLRGAVDGSLFYIRQSVDELPTAHLRPGSQSVQVGCDVAFNTSETSAGDPSTLFGAVEPSIDSSKGIRRWVFDSQTLAAINLTDLDLPTWIPDPSCFRAGVDFNWWQQFDGTVNEVDPGVIETEPLEEKCCQEDFFFCPNIGPCSIEPGGSFFPASSRSSISQSSASSRSSQSSISSSSSSSQSSSSQSSSSQSSSSQSSSSQSSSSGSSSSQSSSSQSSSSQSSSNSRSSNQY